MRLHYVKLMVSFIYKKQLECLEKLLQITLYTYYIDAVKAQRKQQIAAEMTISSPEWCWHRAKSANNHRRILTNFHRKEATNACHGFIRRELLTALLTTLCTS